MQAHLDENHSECEDMGTLSDRLKLALASSGKTKTDIWKACKVSSGAVSQWFSGATKKIEGENLLCAARVLGVNPTWLATGKGRKEPINPPYSSIEALNEQSNISPTKIAIGGRVPLISLVAAGMWEDVVDNYAPGQADEWVSTTLAIKQHTYALRVSGDSMEPRFPDGAIIIVEPEEEARNGSYVIVRQNGNEATFKQLVVDGSHTFLKPLNPRYPIMQMESDAVICGVVKQMVMDV